MWGGVPSEANICNFFRCRKCVQRLVVGGVEEVINVMDGVVPCVEEVTLGAVAKPYREFGVSWCISDHEEAVVCIDAVRGTECGFGGGQGDGQTAGVRVRVPVNDGVGLGSGVCEGEEVGCLGKGLTHGVVGDRDPVGEGPFEGSHVLEAGGGDVGGNGCGDMWDESSPGDVCCGDKGRAVWCGCAVGTQARPCDLCRGC